MQADELEIERHGVRVLREADEVTPQRQPRECILAVFRDDGVAAEQLLVIVFRADPVEVPQERDAVLLGAAMLGTMAAGLHDAADAAMHAMTRIDHVVTPDPRTKSFHDAKYAVYRRMLDDQLTYRAMMTEGLG